MILANLGIWKAPSNPYGGPINPSSTANASNQFTTGQNLAPSGFQYTPPPRGAPSGMNTGGTWGGPRPHGRGPSYTPPNKPSACPPGYVRLPNGHCYPASGCPAGHTDYGDGNGCVPTKTQGTNTCPAGSTLQPDGTCLPASGSNGQNNGNSSGGDTSGGGGGDGGTQPGCPQGYQDDGNGNCVPIQVTGPAGFQLSPMMLGIGAVVLYLLLRSKS